MNQTANDRLRLARERAGFDSAAAFAARHGLTESTYRSAENGSRGLTISAAKRYATLLGIPWQWLVDGGEVPDVPKVPKNPAPADKEPLTDSAINIYQYPRDVPILGSGACGEDGLFELNGQIHGYAKRTPRLTAVKGAYAVYIHGMSMWPWRKPGQLAYVDPYQPPKIEEFVVVQLKATGPDGHKQAYIKQLLRLNAKEIRLHQFNPAEDLTIPMSKVFSVHKVVDWDELMGI